MMNYKSAGLLLFTACAALAQSRTIEVASIRPAQVPDGVLQTYARTSTCVPPGLRIAGNRVEIIASSVCALIRVAHDVQDYNVVGLPKAMTEAVASNYYAIQIQANGQDALTRDDARGLLRELLSERFQLKFHRETRELSVYAMHVGKNGPKMPTTAPENCDLRTLMTAAIVRGLRTLAPCRVDTMAGLAESLTFSSGLDRPVVDRTGLSEKYLVQLEWAANDKSDGPSIFTAVQEQLGLKLDTEKAPVEVMVVDQATRPSEN
jgi:uncharacterized protein (TIGR03435 family)